MSTNNVSLDIDYVKAQFPAFSDPLSSKWSFFENAGGSYVPHNVIKHLNQFLMLRNLLAPSCYFQLHRQVVSIL